MGELETSSELLASLGAFWKRASGSAGRWALGALAILVIVAGAHLARFGTQPARLGAFATLVVTAGLMVWYGWNERRVFATPGRAILRILAPSHPALAARALRAADLVDSAARGTLRGAPELARAHYERLLASASVEAIQVGARERARHYRTLSLVAAGGALCVVLVAPSRVAEGLDVLFAFRGHAPLDWEWLERERVIATPPAYLRQSPSLLGFDSLAVLPQGTDITIRGAATLPDRKLVVVDDAGELPFAEDGHGGLVAHYSVERSTTLRVGSRYGDVLILAPRELEIHALRDATPAVELGQAPRTVKLAEIERLELNWTAHDDYGLKQVDLVLSAGDQEERRPLAQFSGDTRAERGAYTLLAQDSFLRRVFLPVTVQVEARDMSNLPSASWGASKAITVEVPAVGEVEALRMTALMGGRRALTDLFVWQEKSFGSAGKQDEGHQLELRRANQEHLAEALRAVENAIGARYAGLGVPRGVKSFVHGQIDWLRQPRGGLNEAARRTGAVLLALDAALSSLAQRDAQAVSKVLADVAEQAARSAKFARESEKRSLYLDRLGQALEALAQGTEQLLVLGDLGRDLGSVTRAGLSRIARARQNEDLFHTELAALHLAGRLRRPSPSYSSAGGQPGVESGGGGGGDSMPSGPASDASHAFERMAQQLEQLARDHGDALDQVNRTLEETRAQADTSSMRDEARERASMLREAAEGLPTPGGLPGSAQAEASLGREHLQGMAHAFENLDLEQAVESGKRAAQILREARRKAEGSALGEAIQQAERDLGEHLEWAEAKLRDLKLQASERARAQLRGSSQLESELARRTEQIVEQGRGSEAALPRQVEDGLARAKQLMEQAAEALSAGEGDRAYALQTAAQRLLEQSDTTEGKESAAQPPEPADTDQGTGRAIERGGDVPDPEAADGPAEFRRRVLDGLAPGRGGRLGRAIQRYVEGLLQ